MNVFAFFGPGPLELLILGLVCLAVVGVIVAAVAIPLLVSKKGGSGAAVNPNLFPCPDCGNWVSRQAPNCPKCGRTLTGQ